MKKITLGLFLLVLSLPLFSLDFVLTNLEKQIIRANPQEMAAMVQNRRLEKQFFEVFKRYEDEDIELEDIYPIFRREQPNATEADLQFMIFKVGLVSALGSGDFDTVSEGMGLIEFCKEFDSFMKIAESEGVNTEELDSARKSKYWKDCIDFANSFDTEAFIASRFPEY
jgi:hypothetical protein